MINVEIKTKERTIQEKIKDWKELEELLLKYKNYTSFLASNDAKDRGNSNERHTR